MDNNILSKTILAKEYTLQEILANTKYKVDYFQREYKWQRENIEQLITDLVTAFLDNYKEGDNTRDVAYYNTYYMGAIVLGDEAGTHSIIDGQQRITSLTLLLIYLNNQSKGSMSKLLDNLIYSDSYGEISFNLQVPEREDCLKGLYDNKDYNLANIKDESIINMVDRYHDIEDLFPSDTFKDELLKSFIYWVKDKIILVKITAMSKENAYTIFETMNNRGLPLTSSDMLKGYILSKFDNDNKRNIVNKQWKADMLKLSEYGNDTENQFFQAWFRAKYAETIRQSKAGAVNMDFENIGSRFHNWFKDNNEKGGILTSVINGNIEEFIDSEYRFYFNKFCLIKEATDNFDKSLEHIYYNNCYGISPALSYPLYLAPLCRKDDDVTCKAKMDLVAKCLDGFVTRRAVNFKLFSPASIRYTMCNLVKNIRNKSLEELRLILVNQIETDYSFEQMPNFYLHQQNRRFVKYFLCRLTSYIEENSGLPNRFMDYFWNPNSRPQEIEHIWSDHPEWHTDECPNPYDFQTVRNSIGDLVLLPNGVNQSYNDMTSEEKIKLYKENLLAMSLNASAYIHNPSFIKFINTYSLPFKEYTSWRKADIQSHCELYKALAEIIWDKNLY
jgi:uncharacterized protein with ParB-like and HNH nuclease domain